MEMGRGCGVIFVILKTMHYRTVERANVKHTWTLKIFHPSHPFSAEFRLRTTLPFLQPDPASHFIIALSYVEALTLGPWIDLPKPLFEFSLVATPCKSVCEPSTWMHLTSLLDLKSSFQFAFGACQQGVRPYVESTLYCTSRSCFYLERGSPRFSAYFGSSFREAKKSVEFEYNEHTYVAGMSYLKGTVLKLFQNEFFF